MGMEARFTGVIRGAIYRQRTKQGDGVVRMKAGVDTTQLEFVS